MTFSPLRIGIHFIVLLITLLSGSALALNDTQKNMLKQLTLQDYEKLDQELKRKDGLYRKAKSYINIVMADFNRKEKKHFFIKKNRQVAKQMGIKATGNTTKPEIPYTLLRTFNLVQAMIYRDRKVKNSAATVVTNYVKILLSKRRTINQEPTKDIASIEIILENRFNIPITTTTTIRTLNNKQYNFPVKYPPYNILHKKMHLLRNGEFIFTNVNMIREGVLKNGDKIIIPDNLSHLKKSPIKNPASKAREIYISVSRLQAFLDNQYPEKFRLRICDKNMFQVSLDFIAPSGWWKDAFFRVLFNFDNFGEKEPGFCLRYAPEVSHLVSNKFSMLQRYRKYKEPIFDFHNKYPNNFSVEKQMLNIINFLVDCMDTMTKDVFSSDWNGTSPQNAIIQEIINANNLAQQEVNTQVYIETDPGKIEKSVRERIKDGEDPVFNYLTTDEFNSESISTDIFMPVRMYNEAEIIEFDYTTIKKFNDLIYEASNKSRFIIPKSIKPVVYYKHKKLDEHNIQEVLSDIRKGNTKRKKKRDILTMIVKVPGYERRAFLQAVCHADKHYITEQKYHFINSYTLSEIVNTSELRKPIKWEIHLFDNKKQAKANNMLYQYKLILPLRTHKTTERYRGMDKYRGDNVWIPTVRDDMPEVQKKFALMSMYDLSRHKFRISNNLKKASVLTPVS
ncbi:hypothetical protein [Endozoicomonas sp. 4G]|uniref:hypothetical protein n=1 Tax=Endozoicomonas sp. 4G TaxID=2872754 RepID=UPI002078686F|nr:hypothetical protein [Endozoicomonas sp. 4G]